MSVNAAINHFLGKDGYKKLNCAQSVIKAFEKQFELDETAVELFALYGKGKAPDGLCGALYAVKYLSEKNPAIKNFAEFHKLFLEEAGSTKCSEIKDAKKLPCLGCVKICAEFLQKQYP
jgi:hypothetical protein